MASASTCLYTPCLKKWTAYYVS